MNDHGHNHSEDEEIIATARDWVVRLASGEATEDDIQSFKSWLAQSRRHREAFELEQLFWRRLGGLKDASGPETWGDGLRGAKRPAPFGAGRFGRRFLVAGGLAAASFSLFLLFGGWLGVVFLANYRTAEGEQRTISLPDGSIAHLNTATTLTLSYSGTERRVRLLQGEVLFEVSSDQERPFRVDAAGGVIEAVGTAFAVRGDDGAASVVVTKGRVAITSPADGDSAPVALLAGQGERTGFQNGYPPRPVESFDRRTAVAWRQGLIVIDDLPLDQALAELDRYRPGRIVLLGDGTDFESVSGAFDVESVDAAIAGIAATHGLAATELTRYLLILR